MLRKPNALQRFALLATIGAMIATACAPAQNTDATSEAMHAQETQTAMDAMHADETKMAMAPLDLTLSLTGL